MTSVYRRRDKRNGYVYEYETTSYRDPETGRVRTSQTYRGRVDPETGELIPKAGGGKRKRASASRSAANQEPARIAELEAEVAALRAELDRMGSALGACEAFLGSLSASINEYLTGKGSGNLARNQTHSS